MRLVEGKTFAFETNLLLFRLLEPCDGCAAPYGYKHHMPLNTDTSAFSVSYFHSLFDFVILWYANSMHFVFASIILRYVFRLEEPCDGCAAPYGFQHIMQLSENTNTFSVSN